MAAKGVRFKVFNLNNKISWSIIYILATLAANYTVDWFMPLPIYGLLSVGTLFFAVTFTARDYIHHAGRKFVYSVIGLNISCNFLMSASFGVPARFIVASCVAILISESADTEVFQALINRHWLVKVISSNLVSIPLDSLIFNLIAFYGTVTLWQYFEITYADLIAKFIISVAIASFGVRSKTVNYAQ